MLNDRTPKLPLARYTPLWYPFLKIDAHTGIGTYLVAHALDGTLTHAAWA